MPKNRIAVFDKLILQSKQSQQRLLYSAIIPPSGIDPDNTKYQSKPRVVFFITVDAERDTFNVFLSNYRVSGIRKRDVDLETQLTVTIICAAVDRESRQVLHSLSEHLRMHSQPNKR
jgi:hypothetical protein